jgi:outer membrane immunogenic protein
MKKLFLAGIVVSTFCAASAVAADLPTKAPVSTAAPAPILNWTGFYVGIAGGGAWGRSTHDFTGGTHSSFDVSSGLVGGTVGYNWQAGHFLAGLEGDLSWASSSGSTVGSPTLCTGGPCTTKLTWIGTARGRVGYVFDMWMPYVTGGVAFGNVGTCENVTCSSDTHTGWTIGGGIEARLMANWSAKAEYLYVDLGNHSAYTFIVPHTATLTENIVRVGLNYKFGAPY